MEHKRSATGDFGPTTPSARGSHTRSSSASEFWSSSVNSGGTPNRSPLLRQTTEAAAKAAAAAAAAVRPPPSIIVSAKQPVSNLSQKWRRTFSHVWKKTMYNKESLKKHPAFNPEILTQQKRQWSQLQKQTAETKEKKGPPVIFEHFVVVGLHPNANVEATEAAFMVKKAWEKAERQGGDAAHTQYRGHSGPALTPQVLFKYPPGKRLALKDLPGFCFPNGVQARIVERTPSMSELNEIVYGQEYMNRDDHTFVFLLKVADNVTLYGVCMIVQEIVQRPPGVLAMNHALSPSHPPMSRFLVSAPRCYCILTQMPFFDLHFEVLNSVLAQERLDRITQCVNEMALSEQAPPMVRSGRANSPTHENGDDHDDWMDSAIPVQSVLGMTAAAAGLISERQAREWSGPLSTVSASPTGRIEGSEFENSEPSSPLTSGTPTPHTQHSNHSHHHHHNHHQQKHHGAPKQGEEDEGGGGGRASDGSRSEENGEHSQVHPVEGEGDDGGTKGRTLAKGGEGSLRESGREWGMDSGASTPSALPSPGLSPMFGRPRTGGRHNRVESMDSVMSAESGSVVGSMGDFSDDDSLYAESREGLGSLALEEDYGAAAVLAWAEANNNDSLRIVSAYQRVAVPQRGESITFQPLEHLLPTNFTRPPPIIPHMLESRFRHLSNNPNASQAEQLEAEAVLMANEEAEAVACWATATICRVLSLDNVLSVLLGCLLEKQLVVICPNLGCLSAVVLSLVAMLRPYVWQSVLLPILPADLNAFLDAPVPFIVGVQHKTAEVRQKSTNLIRVNVYKDKVKMISSMPPLPRQQKLVQALEPFHTKLRAEAEAKKNPIYKTTPTQARLVEGFLGVLRGYLESFCTDLQSHTITDVNKNNDRVSLLLKESFIDSFPTRDRPFIKMFVETQLFAVHTDAVLSSYQSS